MTLISYLTQKRQPLFFRSAPPPYSYKGFGKLSFKKKAFTLAEVLITLTIIGVVAAMTIPTLMSKYQKHTYVVGLKKAYAELQHASTLQLAENGMNKLGYSYSTVGAIASLDLTNYLKHRAITLGDNSDIYGLGADTRVLQTQNGTIYFNYASDIISSGASTFGVDVNGLKGPNKYGRDIFFFVNIEGKIVPEGSKFYEKLDPSFTYWKDPMACTEANLKKYKINYYGENLGCTARVLEENAMNY